MVTGTYMRLLVAFGVRVAWGQLRCMPTVAQMCCMQAGTAPAVSLPFGRDSSSGTFVHVRSISLHACCAVLVLLAQQPFAWQESSSFACDHVFPCLHFFQFAKICTSISCMC